MEAGEFDAVTLPAAFTEAMDDDLSVPQALAVLHNTVREGNAALAESDKSRVARHLVDVAAMLGVLGLADSAIATTSADDDMRPVIDSLVSLALEQRTAARARKDYPAADAIRDQLAAAGIVVEDTAAGVRWQLKTRTD